MRDIYSFKGFYGELVLVREQALCSGLLQQPAGCQDLPMAAACSITIETNASEGFCRT